MATGSAKAPEFGCSNIPSTISSQRFCQTTMKEKVLLQQQQQDEETEKPVNFPPRKRSIPYGMYYIFNVFVIYLYQLLYVHFLTYASFILHWCEAYLPSKITYCT